jgi:signal transduction histidine kinase
MRERVAKWGGETTIASKPGRGTTVTVQMPTTSPAYRKWFVG